MKPRTIIETVKSSEPMGIWRYLGRTAIYALIGTGISIVSYQAGTNKTKTLFAEEAPEWVKDLPLAIQVQLKKSLQDVPDELKDAPLFIDATPASIDKVENPQ